ncbi:ATP-binding protein [Aquimarina muelleri]|uniref:tetratricopeptide repeat-containing sensor histidine kinase n=1 Tax=Aquimarina muelleri TaxID=279356 RepID=UPI003F6884CE
MNILFLVLCYSCFKDTNTNDLSLIQLQKKIDSLNTNYLVASQRSNVEAEKLEAIDNFLKGVTSLNLDSLVYKGLKSKSNILYKHGHHQKAIEQVNLMVELAQRNGDSSNLGKAFYKIGYFYKKQENYLEAFKYYNQSFKVLRNIKDSINAGACLMEMSSVQRALGDHNASKATATDGLKYLENSTEYRIISGLYQGISRSFSELGNQEEALLWNSKILDLCSDSIAKKNIGVHNLPIFKNARATILAEQQKYAESIHILQSLLKDKNVIQKRTRYAQVLSNLGYIKFLQNPKNPESETMLLQALDIREQEEDIFGLFNSNIHLTKYYRDKTIKITVYRVLQELMTNMQKHSKASLVKLVFSNTKDFLNIKYTDNGVGVTEEHVKSKNGLRNTENRIRAIRGTLIFESEKDKGFTAEIQIPN